jgi:GTP cyclohydrolase I
MQNTTIDTAAETPLADMQNTIDRRNIPIDRVGVRKVKYPMNVLVKGDGIQQTVGTFSLTVDLPKQFKGTHMSRFLEVLANHNHEISCETIPGILDELRARLMSDTAHLDVSFTYFLEKAAPVTQKVGMMGYDCGFSASGGATEDFEMSLTVPVTTLCPCSREISSYGAHNQRGYVSVRVRPEKGDILWLEDVIEMIESAASAPLYPLLKRPDEKFVTEQAYDNPRFVEDMVREVALSFDRDPRIAWYEIEVENHESIHDHNAYACLKRDKKVPRI